MVPLYFIPKIQNEFLFVIGLVLRLNALTPGFVLISCSVAYPQAPKNQIYVLKVSQLIYLKKIMKLVVFIKQNSIYHTVTIKF